jgi:hypothetical protein
MTTPNGSALSGLLWYNVSDMSRDETLRILREHREEIEAMGVKSIAIFGSTARDEAREDSDVDVLVEFSREVGLFDFLDVKEKLERIVGRRVDLVTDDALRSQMRPTILKEAVRAI